MTLGIPFSATLIGILLAHEFGHFWLAEKNGVYATLPYFVPAPTLIGTFGALIRIKSPIRSRQALFDIGIAGPIAGFLVAVPVLCWGLGALQAHASRDVQARRWSSAIRSSSAWFVDALAPFTPHAASLASLYLHPVGVAAWVGMFATALNLLPGGQFDGGHILYAVAPRAHKWVTRLSILALFPLGYFYWDGWLVWAVILGFTGCVIRACRRGLSWISRRRQFALIGLLILLLTFALAPIRGTYLREIIRGTPSESAPTKTEAPPSYPAVTISA